MDHFDSAMQGGDSAGVAVAAHVRHHPAPYARPRHRLVFTVSNAAAEEEENEPGWSTYLCRGLGTIHNIDQT